MTGEHLLTIARSVMTPKQWEAWELSRVHGCSYRTIAFMLDIDKGTVRDRVKRGDQRVDRWKRQNTKRARPPYPRPLPDDRAGNRASQDLAQSAA